MMILNIIENNCAYSDVFSNHEHVKMVYHMFCSIGTSLWCKPTHVLSKYRYPGIFLHVLYQEESVKSWVGVTSGKSGLAAGNDWPMINVPTFSLTGH